MTPRAEHLAWCKQRAIAELDAGDINAAKASMISDLGKWDGGEMYRPDLWGFVTMDALTRRTSDQVRGWIEGFN